MSLPSDFVIDECQSLSDNKYYFSLMCDDVLIDKIETKCKKEDQIIEINNFLKKHKILNESMKVSLIKG